MSEGRNLLEVVLNTNIAKKFNEVDNSVASLQERFVSATTAANNFALAIQNVTNSLNASSTGDFAAKISQLIDSMTRLNSAGNNSAGLTAMQEGIQNVGISATQNVDMINRLIEAINKLPEAFSRTSTKIKTEGTGGKDILDSLLYDTSGLEKKKAEFQALIDDLQNRIKTISLKEINAGLDTISFDNLFRMTKQVIDEFEATSGKKIDNIKNKLIELAQVYEQKASSGTLFDTNIIDEYETLRTILVSLKEEYQNMLKAAENYKNQSMDSNALQQGYKVQLETLDRSLKSLEKDFEEIGKEIEEFSSRNEKIKNSVRQIEEYKEKIKELDKEFERLKMSKLAFDEDGKLTKEARDLLEEKKGYEEQIKLYQISADEAIKQEQRKVEEEKKLEREKFEEIQKLYAERLELEKKSASVETSRKVKEMSGVDTTKETELLAKYNQRIEELKNKILDLQIEYQDLHQEAKKTYDIKSLESQIKEEDKRRNAIDRTTKQIERLTAAEAREAQQELGTVRKPQTVEEYRIAIRNLQQQIEKMPVGDKTGIAQLNEKIKQYQRELDEAVPKTQRFRQENEKLGSVMRQVASAFGIYIGLQSITNLARNVAKTTGEFELQHRALQAIIGDMQSANQLWDKTIRLAVRSPYNVKQLVTYTKQLAAYRVETEKLYDTTKMLADISAGLGVDMQRLILAYGQVKAANYLRGQELRQFSEAGINILGELAKYFTELKGQAISTGDVFEMVSKRMVKFEDVAEVLKRMTEEGGAFYQMQEIQAETLSGMYANLKDRIDIMLNSIGTETRGVFVNIIKFATFLIEHWQSLSNMLTAGLIVWAAYKAEVWRAASAKGAFTANTIAATAAEGGFIGMIAKSKIALKSFAASIKTIFTTGLGWVGIALAAITTIINVIIQHNRKIDEAKKKYDELNQGVYKNGISGFNKLSSAIEKNNNELKENNRLLEEAKRAGDKEKELKLQNEINRVQEDNKKIVEEISQNYSELSDNISISVDGLVDIGANAQKLARIKTIETDLTNIFSENAGKKSDIIELTHKLEDAQKGYEVAMNQFNTEYKIWLNEMENRIESISGVSQEYKDKVQSIIDNKTLNNWEKYNKLLETNYDWQSGLGNLIIEMSNNAASSVEKAQGKVENAEKKISEEVGRASEKLSHLYDPATEKETAENAIEEFIKNLGFMKGKVADFLSQMFSEKLDITVSVTPSDDKKSLQTWQIKINDFIDKTMKDVTFEVSPKITDEQQTQEAYAKFVKGLVDDAQKIIDIWTKIGDETKQDVVTQQQYNNAVAQLPHLQELSRRAGNLDKNKNGKSNPALELLNKQIDAIKRANAEYKKYQELFDDTTAFNKTKEDFKDLFDELNLTPYINSISSFSDAVVKEAFESRYLKKFVTAAGKQGEIAGAKFSSGFLYQIDKDLFDETIKNFDKKISSAFDKYEIGQELEKIGVGKDVIKAIFDIDAMNIVELENYLEKLRKEIEKDFGGKKAQEWYEKQLDKINEKKIKELEARMKRVAEYIAKSSDRIIYEQMKGIEDISFGEQLAREGKITAEQFVQLVKNVTKDVNDAVGKIRLDAFKDTDTYIAAMGNLSAYTTEELKKLAEALREVISQNSGQMTADEMEAYYKALQKVTKKINDLDKQPFGENVFARIKKIKQINEEINRIQEERARLLEQEEQIQKRIAYYQQMADEETDDAAKQYWLEQIVSANNESSQVQSNLNECSALLGEMGVEMGEFGGAAGGAAQAIKEIDTIIQAVNDSIIATVKIFEDLKDMADSFGIDVDEGSWRQASNFFNILSDFNENAYQGWEDLKSGNIIGAVQNTISSIVRLIKNINLWIDSGYQETIEKQQDEIDSLERAYTKLERAADKAWDAEKLKEYNEQIQENIDLQIKAIRAQIEAEQNKKNPDQELIDDWNDSIDELIEDKEEKMSDFLEKIGGIGDENYGSIAQEFVDSWYDAFRETGDGIEGLEGKFDELLENIVKKQAALRIANKLLEPLFKMIDEYGEDGIYSAFDMDNIRTWIDENKENINNSFKSFFESLGLLGGEAEGELSGLQKGIQGVTEETAEIIAAYLNSIRFYIIDTNTKIGQLIAAIQDTTGMSNPMLQELRNIKQKTEEIRDFLYQRQEYGDNSLRVFVTNP